MALRLPMSGGFESFSNVRDIPFIARHATRHARRGLQALKLPADKPIVLASFGGYGLPGLDTDALAKFKKYTVVDDGDGAAQARAQKDTPAAERKGSFVSINEEAMYDTGVRYEDLVGAAEAVVTKPGYGIISECIANDTAILYTLARPLPRVRRARRGDAEVSALGLHQPRRSVRRQMGVAPRQAARAAEAEEEAGDQRRRRRRRHPAEGARQAAEEAARTAEGQDLDDRGRRLGWFRKSRNRRAQIRGFREIEFA